MSLLSEFSEFLRTDIEVYSLTATTGSWGTTEKVYPDTATKTITGYVQPVSGSLILRNQANNIDLTHTLYCFADEAILDTDRIKVDGEFFAVTNNPVGGVAKIADHKEVGLKRVQ